MSIRKRIFLLVLLVCLVATAGAAWIGFVALRSVRADVVSMERTMDAVEASATMAGVIRGAEEAVDQVLQMTDFTDPAAALGEFEATVAEVDDAATRIDLALGSETVSGAVVGLKEALAVWHGHVRVVLGADPAASVPTAELLARDVGEAAALANHIRDEARAEAERAAEAATAGTLASLAASGGGMLAIMALALVFAMRSAGRISGPVRDVSRDLRALASSDGASTDPAGNRDEIVDMRAAMVILAESLAERDRMVEREREEAAEAQRTAAAEAALQAEIRTVVEAASAGDFRARVKDSPMAASDPASAAINSLLSNMERAVSDMSQMLRALAAGDTSAQMTGTYGGVLAEMRGDADATGRQLGNLVGDIRAVARELGDSIGQIVSGADDLSGRSQSQAAALEELAATIEEMTRTVEVNAENSTNADRLSRDVAGKAGEGGQVAGRAIEAIRRIDESTAKIKDIVGLVESIAFQTNLLALNAAVEAARAGESGKGFAVVASEVRSLAQRAADATRDITVLVGESSACVADGVEMVQATGESLSDIHNGIEELAKALADLSSANQSQAKVIGEINTTVTGMDGDTQRNASLSSQSAATATALQDQADRLSGLIARFSGGGDAGATAAGAARRAA